MLRLGFFAIVVSTLIAFVGCGPSNVAEVEGVVTLDGKPLPDATVTFYPDEKGAVSSNGKTNESGKYTLNYDSKTEGAVVGKHRVFVRLGESEVDETLPAVYNSKTTLTAEVAKGSNSFDFDLKSKP